MREFWTKLVQQAIVIASLSVSVTACNSSDIADIPEQQVSKERQAVPFSEEVLTRQALTQVALARTEADLLIHNVTMLNVFTQEWLTEQDIVIAKGRIAWIGDSGGWNGIARETYDASGLWAVPGFGESHKHIESSYLTAEYEAALVIPRGNTWTVEGSHEISNVVGNKVADFWVEAEQLGSPLKIFPAIGSATPPTAYESGGGYFAYEEMQTFLGDHLRVVALGEVMDWSAVINADNPGHRRIWEMIQATYDGRGVVEGHGSRLTEANEINAFAAAGLSSDHEVRLVEEGIDKLRRGIFLEVKKGTIEVLMPKLVEMNLADWSNISVTTDDRDVFATLQLGSMDYNIRSAIKAGVPTEIAYQLGSYNTARHFHIEHLVGSIAPGRYADIVLLSDPETVTIERVYANGMLASIGKQYLLPIPKINYPKWATDTMNVGRKITAKDLEIVAPEGRKTIEAAILQPFWFEPDFMTKTLPVAEDGTVVVSTDDNLIKVAVVDRYHGTAGVSKMFWQNVGPKTPNSALSSSQSHDLHNIWTIGNDDNAMALAANTVAEMGGGWALVSQGKVVAKVALQIGGLMTDRPVEEVAAEMEKLLNAADEMEWIGEPGLPETMRFAFLTAAPWKWQLVAPYEGNPTGLVDVTTGNTHPVVW
ncbi:adenine deaminase [Methylophaga sp.]|uniref:adenine deaminase n=1 Tax=Methylophaga sp. TaxID=2024840 RepID=UPI002720336E|nr:adenine deaminase C-terminal domain-containing protein [Methylophaga sp.]MDO8826874.1 adenine deaminase C-terminal domain-containing protein [Methylophaga sp.]